MRKILVWCLVIVSLVFTACSPRTMGEDDHINIFCFRYQIDDIQKAYGKARVADDSMPMINFVTPDQDFSNTQELYDSLMKGFLTKSPDIDLFVINGQDQYAYEIIENHYYVDLSREESLLSHYDAMYPEIVDWCSHDGEIFGFPYHVFYYMQIMADEGKMRSVGFTVDDIGAMDGLLDFCAAWEDRNAVPPTAGYYQRALCYCENYLLLHYDRSTGEMNLDTSEFRSLLSQCKELADREFFQEPYGMVTDVDEGTSPLYFGVVHIIPQEHRQYIPIHYPLLEAEPQDTKRYASIYWFVINPYSDHIDQVMSVLEYYAQIAGGTDLIVTPIYRDPAYYTDTGLYSPENLDQAAPFISNSFVGLNFPGYHEVLAILDAYVTDGTKTLDEAVAEAQRVLDTVRQEQFLD